jgi:hypothetical protein
VSRNPGALMWTVGVLFLAAPSVAIAQQQFGDPGNYPGTYLTYQTSPGQSPIDVTYYIAPGSFSPTEVTLIQQAAAIWSNPTVTGTSLVLVEVTSPAGAQITLSSADLDDVTFNLAQRTLNTSPGAGTFPDGRPWRHIDSSIIVIDSDPPGPPPYFIGGGNVPPSRYDFRSLILREFGIALGLGFTTAGDPNSVMDLNLALGEQHRVLSPGDITAAQTLYGAPEPATWALLGIGLAIVGGSRKLRRR